MSDEDDIESDPEPGDEYVGTPLGDEAGVYIPPEEREETSDDGDDESEAPIDFGGFLVSLGTNCMVNLGHVEHPETGDSAVNLPAAKQTIEILKLLKHKTRGNLEPDEEKLMESLLHDTKLAYREAKEEYGEDD